MTFSKLRNNQVMQLGAVLGGICLGLPLIASSSMASSFSVAQIPVPQQSPVTPIAPQDITIPISPGVDIPLSQIRVATLPPAPQNPCPGLYYEYPFAQQVVVPQGCLANQITQRLEDLGYLEMVRQMNNVNQIGIQEFPERQNQTYPNRVY